MSRHNPPKHEAVRQVAATSRRHHATSDAEFDGDEIEFLLAIEEFKRCSGKKFPNWTDVLRVCRALGYAKPNYDQADGPDSWPEMPCYSDC